MRRWWRDIPAAGAAVLVILAAVLVIRATTAIAPPPLPSPPATATATARPRPTPTRPPALAVPTAGLVMPRFPTNPVAGLDEAMATPTATPTATAIPTATAPATPPASPRCAGDGMSARVVPVAFPPGDLPCPDAAALSGRGS